jgi:hypothetical protein
MAQSEIALRLSRQGLSSVRGKIAERIRDSKISKILRKEYEAKLPFGYHNLYPGSASFDGSLRSCPKRRPPKGWPAEVTRPAERGYGSGTFNHSL